MSLVLSCFHGACWFTVYNVYRLLPAVSICIRSIFTVSRMAPLGAPICTPSFLLGMGPPPSLPASAGPTPFWCKEGRTGRLSYGCDSTWFNKCQRLNLISILSVWQSKPLSVSIFCVGRLTIRPCIDSSLSITQPPNHADGRVPTVGTQLQDLPVMPVIWSSPERWWNSSDQHSHIVHTSYIIVPYLAMVSSWNPESFLPLWIVLNCSLSNAGSRWI